MILGKRMPTPVFVALGTLTGSYVVERLARGWSYVGGQNGIPSLPRLTFRSYEIVEGKGYYYVALGSSFWSISGLRVADPLAVRARARQAYAKGSRIAFFGYKVQSYKGCGVLRSPEWSRLERGSLRGPRRLRRPRQFGPVLSTQAVLYVLFGGVGTLSVGLVGVAIIDLFSYLLSQRMGDWLADRAWDAVARVVMGFKPTGLIGFLVTARELRRLVRPPATARRRGSPKRRERKMPCTQHRHGLLEAPCPARSQGVSPRSTVR